MDRGALGLVLRLSRIFGIAPFVRHAEHYQVSTALLIYGVFIIICGGIYTVSTITIILLSKHEITWVTIEVVNIAYIVIKLTILAVGVSTSGRRMMRMAKCLKKFDQVNAKKDRSQNSLTILVVLFIAVFLILRWNEVASFKEIHFKNSWLGMVFLLVSILVNHAEDLLIMQIVLFANIVLSTLENVNYTLQKMIPDQHFVETPAPPLAEKYRKFEKGYLGTSENDKISSRHMPRPAWEDVESVKQIATDPNVDIVINRSNKNIAHAFSYKVNCDTLAATREQTVLHTIRRLAGSYMSVCNVIVGFNSNDGFLIILLLATNALQMEKYLYTIVLIQWSNQPYCIGGDYLNDVFSLYVISYLKFYEDEELEEKNLVIMKPPYNVNDMQFFWQFLWCIMLSMKLISIVEPFHRTHAQMFRTHVLINYLKCQRWDDQAISNELETFVRLLMLRNPTYSPLNMITLERSFLIQLSGCILTYLVIMLTYGLEVLI